MLCQICKVDKASVKITQVIDDKKIELNLCKSCAEKKGIDNPMTGLPQFVGNFMAELFGKEILQRSAKRSGIRCHHCGTSWENFKNTGLFGCDICYQVFEDDLKVILRRIHGSNQHIGSRPNSQRTRLDEAELERMKADLRKAIEQENFELAAELRDLVRNAERQFNKSDNDGILR